MNKSLIVQLTIIFIITQALGLIVAGLFIQNDLKAQLLTGDSEDVLNSVGLIVWIIIFSGILLVMIKFLREKTLYYILKVIESLAIFGTSYLIFSVIIYTLTSNGIAADIAGIGLAVVLVGLRILFSGNVALRNVTSVFATAGAGALIGVSLGVLPVVVLLVLLAAYDFIAVFKTKHMVQLAKTVTSKNLSFTYALPTPSHQFELGTGDLVMPLVFASSVLAAMQPVHQFPYSIIPSIAVLAASYVGLVLTLDYVSKREGTALPALPPQTILMLLTFGALKLIGF